ncbi:unnamed protein product [Urochloa humidicola]
MTGLYKGYGFIQFALLEDAKAAQSLNGQLDIAGRVIKVSAVCSDFFSSTCSSNVKPCFLFFCNAFSRALKV